MAVEVAYDDTHENFARLEEENPYVDGDNNTTNDVRDDNMLHDVTDLIFLFASMLHALTLYYVGVPYPYRAKYK